MQPIPSGLVLLPLAALSTHAASVGGLSWPTLCGYVHEEASIGFRMRALAAKLSWLLVWLHLSEVPLCGTD